MSWNLPPLPQRTHGFDAEPLYTAEQMRAYARAAIAALVAERGAAVADAEPAQCAHVWKVTPSGVTYHDCRCDKCGATKRETWD